MGVPRRLGLAALAAALTGSMLVAQSEAQASPAPKPGTECVAPTHGCFATISKALASAAAGDTIYLGPGTYRGGFTITKNVRLIGAGQTRTVIRGGGPVVTVAATQPVLTVTLADLALTGGTAAGNATSDGVRGFGGGLYIPSNPGSQPGASVSLDRVWVHGNRATATANTSSPSGVLCPNGECPFAFGAGGGIFNSGRMSIINSRIDNNTVDGQLSDADGGGIYSQIGSLSLVSSVVADNQAHPQGIGRFAEGGGLFVDTGNLTISHTTIASNSADLNTSWPILGQGTVIGMNANSGGIHVGDGSQVSITSSRITGNRISAVDPAGEPAAFDSALNVGDSTATIVDTDFDQNSSFANSATDVDAGFSGTAVEFDGPAHVSRSRISDNTATSVSTTGPAGVSDGLAVYDFSNDPRQVTVADSAITDNRSYAYSAAGGAIGTGGGVLNNSLLALDNVTVSGNTVCVGGPSATAQGGGIWNGALLSGPPVQLALSHSHVTGNSVSATSGGTSQGGGVYTAYPITRTATDITGNKPDNIFQE